MVPTSELFSDICLICNPWQKLVQWLGISSFDNSEGSVIPGWVINKLYRIISNRYGQRVAINGQLYIAALLLTEMQQSVTLCTTLPGMHLPVRQLCCCDSALARVVQESQNGGATLGWRSGLALAGHAI
jgi:hypothetical protein